MAQIRYVKLNNDNDAAAIESNQFEMRFPYPILENKDLKKLIKNSVDTKYAVNDLNNDSNQNNLKAASPKNDSVKENKEINNAMSKQNNQSKNKKMLNKNKKNTGKSPRLQKSNGNKKSGKPSGPRKSDNNLIWLLYAIAILAVAFMIYTFYDFFSKKDAVEETKISETTVQAEGIADNIYFEGISLAGMNKEDFLLAAKEKDKELAAKTIEFINEKDESKHLNLTIEKIGFGYDVDKLYENAVVLSDLIKNKQKEQTQEATFLSNLVNASPKVDLSEKELDGLAQRDGSKINLLPIYSEDETKLNEAIEEISKTLRKDVETEEEVTFNLATLQFEYPVTEIGYKIDDDIILDKIMSIFKNDKLTEKVILPFETIESGLSTEEINEKLGYISSGYTAFVTYDEARDSNVARVAEILTGLVVMPGEVFSYIDTISPITVENGFTEGYQIGSDGQPEKILGGGICQGSSTLYNALGKADIEIVERNNHTVPSLYIYQGLDAMVSDWSDFKFKNNTDYPLAIVGTCVPNEYIQFDIYGRKLEDGVTIDFEPYMISEEQPGEAKRVLNKDLTPGSEYVKTNAIVGSYWSTDKVYYKDGVEFQREHYANSHYWAYAAVIEYGPTPEETTASETTSEATTSETTMVETTTEAPSETYPPEMTPPLPVDPDTSGETSEP